MEGRICLIHKVRRNVGVEKCLDVAVNNGDVIQLMVGWRCMLISRSDSSLIHDFFLSITRDFCYKKFLLGDTLAEHRRVLSFHRQSMLLNVSFVVRPPLPVSSLNIRWLLVNAKVTVWLPGLIFFFLFCENNGTNMFEAKIKSANSFFYRQNGSNPPNMHKPAYLSIYPIYSMATIAKCTVILKRNIMHYTLMRPY